VARPSFVPLNQSVPVNVRVTNRGLTTISNGSLSFEVFYEEYNRSARVTEESRALLPLDEGETRTIAFAFTPTLRGTYLVEAAVQVTGDEFPENNIRIVHLVAGEHLLLEDVEGDTSAWTLSNDLGSPHRWDVVEDGEGFGTAHGPTRSWRFGYFGTFGAPMAYPFYHLTSPEILLAGEVPRLLFYQRYQLATASEESGGDPPESDRAAVAVSFEGGAWIEVVSFTGIDLDWAPVYVDLAPFAQGAARMQVRFTATAGAMPEEGGWWIDDVVILQVPLAPVPLLKPLESPKEVIPGGTVSLLFLVVNVGDVPGTVTFLVQGLPVDWEALLGRNETSAIAVTAYADRLGPDQQRALNLMVRAPLLAERGVLHQGILVALMDEGNEADFVFSLQVPLGFGFDLSGGNFLVALIIGGVMLALAMVLTGLRRRRRRTYPPY
ncbi:MAG: hypothetical protein V3U70_02460, partial [Thermoplasmata archaeon]